MTDDRSVRFESVDVDPSAAMGQMVRVQPGVEWSAPVGSHCARCRCRLLRFKLILPCRVPVRVPVPLISLFQCTIVDCPHTSIGSRREHNCGYSQEGHLLSSTQLSCPVQLSKMRLLVAGSRLFPISSSSNRARSSSVPHDPDAVGSSVESIEAVSPLTPFVARETRICLLTPSVCLSSASSSALSSSTVEQSLPFPPASTLAQRCAMRRE